MAAEITSELEQVVGAVKYGQLGTDALLESFRQSTVALPSTSDPAQQGVTPVLVEIEGLQHMVVASSSAGLQKTAEIAPFAVTLQGQQVLAGLDPRFGVLLHTAQDTVALPPDLLRQIR